MNWEMSFSNNCGRYTSNLRVELVAIDVVSLCVGTQFALSRWWRIPSPSVVKQMKLLVEFGSVIGCLGLILSFLRAKMKTKLLTYGKPVDVYKESSVSLY